MDYKVHIDGEAYLFSISGSGRSLRVSRNGESLPVDFREVGPDAYSLLIGGKAHLVTTQADTGGLTVRMDGRSYSTIISQNDGAETPGGDLRTAGAREVRSVMPGIVTRLLVAPGDAVKTGTPLLVLEAMKMENEVRSHRDGVVEAVHVDEQKAVDAGDLLVTVT